MDCSMPKEEVLDMEWVFTTGEALVTAGPLMKMMRV